MRKGLNPGDLGDLLEQARLAVLATKYPDGTVLLSPVWHEWVDGGFSVPTGAGDVKVRQARRDPRGSIVLAEDTPPYRGIEVRGTMTVTNEGAPAALLRIASRYLGTDAGRAYAEGSNPADLVVMRIVPGVLRAWDFADEYTLSGNHKTDGKPPDGLLHL